MIGYLLAVYVLLSLLVLAIGIGGYLMSVVVKLSLAVRPRRRPRSTGW